MRHRWCALPQGCVTTGWRSAHPASQLVCVNVDRHRATKLEREGRRETHVRAHTGGIDTRDTRGTRDKRDPRDT